MPKLAANLSMLYTERPFLERFAAAAEAGFRAVEYQFPYALAPAAEVGRAAREAGVQVVLHNLPAGDPAKGDRGLACLPARRSEFREGVELAIGYAREAGCRRLNCLAGIGPRDAVHRDTLIENVRYAAGKLGEAGMQLMLEAINTRTVPGFFLTGSAQAIELLDAAGEPNAYLQYDLFHMQVMEGDISSTVARLLPRIGHMQIADVPGRHEPGTGELNFPWLLAEIDRLGYAGWIGCEYNPSVDTRSSLAWAKRYLTKP